MLRTNNSHRLSPWGPIAAPRALRSVACLAAAGVAILVTSASFAAQGPKIDISRADSDLVLSYSLVQGIIADADPTPLIRLYGSGRVHVHYAPYLKKAGDWQVVLTPAEVNGLLATLASFDLMTVNDAAVEERFQAAQSRALSGDGLLFSVSDPVFTVIELNLRGFSPSPQSTPVAGLSRTLAFQDLGVRARRDTADETLQRLFAADLEIRSLLDHPGLEPLRR